MGSRIGRFQFQHKVSPRKTNNDVDVLSSLQSDLNKNMEDCTAEMEKDAICATTDVVKGDEPRVTTVSANIDISYPEAVITD